MNRLTSLFHARCGVGEWALGKAHLGSRPQMVPPWRWQTFRTQASLYWKIKKDFPEERLLTQECKGEVGPWGWLVWLTWPTLCLSFTSLLGLSGWTSSTCTGTCHNPFKKPCARVAPDSCHTTSSSSLGAWKIQPYENLVGWHFIKQPSYSTPILSSHSGFNSLTNLSFHACSLWDCKVPLDLAVFHRSQKTMIFCSWRLAFHG